MSYTKEEVIEFVQMEDVKFIRLAFCDIFGNQKTPQLFQTSLNAHSKKESHLTALRLQDSQMKRIPTFFFSRFLQRSQFFRGGQFPVKLCVCSAKSKKVTELHLKKTAATF